MLSSKNQKDAVEISSGEEEGNVDTSDRCRQILQRL